MSQAQAVAEAAREALSEALKARKEKRPPLIALGWASSGLLFSIVAVMSFFASLAAGGTLTIDRVFASWSIGLTQAVTVQLVPTKEMAASEQVERALVVLEATPGVREVKPIGREEASALLEPWLGEGNLPADLALPQLVDVRVDTAHPPDLAILADRLKNAVPGAVLDTHLRWKGQLLTFWSWVRLLEALALGLIGVATVATIVFATRAVLETNRELVDLLHLMGAHDAFIAGEFQRHFSIIGSLGGLAGALAALAALWGLAIASRGNDYFAPALASDSKLFLLAVLVPVAVCGVTLLTARVTALTILRRTI
ncbi:MAG: hypothetical protein H6923_02585 [Alphaproteobacteria bacterium]|nr:hypothetical protein [Alphaproteobacteria bacterium]